MMALCILAAFPADAIDNAKPTSVAPDIMAKIRPQLTASRYAFDSGKDGILRASNQAHSLEIAADASGVRVRDSVVLRAMRVWSSSAAGEVLPQDVHPSSIEGRIEYRRGNVVEWFANTPSGLEQGFTIMASPQNVAGSTAGNGTISLLVNVACARTLSIDADGQRATITDERGRVYGYGGLKAWDATGRTLACRLESWNNGVHESATAPGTQFTHSDPSACILVVCDARDAVYPVTIDPLLSSMEKRLTASDGTSGDQSGTSVSVAGDVALVGANTVDVAGKSDAGAAYLYERNQGGPNAWGEVKKLVASDGTNDDLFGTSVSVAGDVALVGAQEADPSGRSSAGAVYLFERNAGGTNAWGEVKKLVAADGAAGDRFGYSVSVCGDVAVVGAYVDGDLGAFSGSAYVFERNAGGTNAWGQVAKLKAADGSTYSYFGISVCVAGDTVVVGADGTESGKGSAYVFERNADSVNSWKQVAKLTASDGEAADQFGNSVSVDGDVVVVGAFENDLGTSTNAGSAYVFERNAGGTNAWGQVAILTASDGAMDDWFGRSVSVAGNVAVVGANAVDVSGNDNAGAMYVYERNAGGTNAWGEVATLTAPDGGPYHNYGYTVSVRDGIVLSGAWGHNGNQGTTYIVPIQFAVWQQRVKLSPSDYSASGQFGQSVAVAGDVAVVGESYGNSGRGEAYVFERNAGGTNAWGQVARLSADDGATDDQFGWAVSVDGDVAIVAANAADPFGMENAGAVYVFERNAGGINAWGQVAKLTASDGATSDLFGYSVSVDGDVVLVGSVGDEMWRGSAYLFERNAGGTNAWGEVKKIFESECIVFDNYGSSVCVDGDTALVGAQKNGGSGSAYVYQRDADGTNAWGKVAKLRASDGGTDDHRFGVSVSVAGSVAVVGAFYDDPNGTAMAGSAYLYERNAGGTNAWGQVKKLTASDGMANDNFGMSVSIAGDVVVAGAIYADTSAVTNSGAVYIFERNSGGTNAWSQVKRLTDVDVAESHGIGNSVCIDGDVVIAGMALAHSYEGGAYIFEGFLYTPPAPAVAFLGTNGAVISSGAAASLAAGTDFGSVVIGTSLTNTFVVTNGGNATLTISASATNGGGAADFAVTGLPASVAAGASVSFTISYTPSAGGASEASLLVDNNANNYTVNLAGFGAGGGIKLSTNLLIYAATYAGSSPASQTVVMTNIGIMGFSYTNSITYGGGAADWLTVSPGSGSVSLDGGSVLTNTVSISGVNAGTYRATNRVTSADATNSPQTYVAVLTIDRASQSITFSNPGAQYTTNTVGLAATASSGLQVSFDVLSGSASITGGTNLSFTGAGSVSIVASQAGDTNWKEATSITNTFNVTKVTAGVTLNDLSQVYDGTARLVTATTQPGGLTVDFTYNGGSMLPTNAATYVVTGVVNEALYQGVQTGLLTVAKANQTGLTFSPASPQTYNTTNALSAGGGQSSGGWTFSVQSGTAQITGSTNLWMQTGTGSVTVRATKAGDANWNSAYAEATVTAAKSGQAITFAAIADQVTTNRVGLSASASSGLPVSFATNGGPATITAGTNLTFMTSGLVSIVASQAGDANWSSATSVTNTFNVTKAAAQVTLTNLTQAYNGSPRPVSAATVPAGLTVDLTYNGSATPPDQVGSYSVTGTVNDLVYSGSSTGLLTVTKGNQTINFTKIPVQRRTNTAHVVATASSGLPVTFAVVSGPAILADWTNLTFSGCGRVTVNASQAGDAQWNSASTSRSFIVSGVKLDFDGDGKSDYGCYDSAGIPGLVQPGQWYFMKSTDGFDNSVRFGYAGTVPVAGDFDGDGKSDYGCYDAAGIPGLVQPGQWYFMKSTNGFDSSITFGYAGTVPVVGDFDGDGIDDYGCYDAAGIPGLVEPGQWYFMKSRDGFDSSTRFGYAGTRPVVGDYDGDGMDDFGCYDAAGIPGLVTPGAWYFMLSTDGFGTESFGYQGTVPIGGLTHE